MTTRSTFSPLGLPIGANNENLTYLYGMSDFFAMMFENPELINLTLEAQTQSASDIYSNFLQLTSQISITDIQLTLGSTLKLVTIDSANLVPGTINSYTISDDIVASRYIADRAFLPNVLIEYGADFQITQDANGISTITFAKPIGTLGFPSRTTSTGSIQYAIWLVDAEIDQRWLSTKYGALLGITPENSTQTFKNYISGLYYVYSGGPTLDLIKKGLNLALGIPICRGNETVLDIRNYLETDQYIIITDQNQYVIPYGLTPLVNVGDSLTATSDLAQWVVIKDYESDGDWWVNMYIPSSLIPSIPPGQPSRFAYSGSIFDQLMRQYLKKHTFLVQVNVTTFKDLQVFQELGTIIRNSKPTYTEAIYVWAVETQTETLTLSDSNMTLSVGKQLFDNITNSGIDKMMRDATKPLARGNPIFIRYDAPSWLNPITGIDAYVNVNSFPLASSTLGSTPVTGFINPIGQYRPSTQYEIAWQTTLWDRDTEVARTDRGKLGFRRGVIPISMSAPGVDNTSIPSQFLRKMFNITSGTNIVPMYVTTQMDLAAKCAASGIPAPDVTKPFFSLFQPLTNSLAIDDFAIDGQIAPPVVTGLIPNYNNFNNRGLGVNYLGTAIPPLGAQQWVAPNVSALTPTDFIIGSVIIDNFVALYLVTANISWNTNNYYPVNSIDTLSSSFTTRPNRGAGPTSSPYYLVRGRGVSLDNTGSGTGSINSTKVEGALPSNGGLNANPAPYSDALNLNPTVFTRQGYPLNHKLDSN